jgi:hypothetical protein
MSDKDSPFPQREMMVASQVGHTSPIRRVQIISLLSAGSLQQRPRSGKTKDYKIGICCFSAKHAALRRKSKDWLARNQDNVSIKQITKKTRPCYHEMKV